MRGVPVVATLEAKLVATNTLDMVTACLFLNYAFALAALSAVIGVVQSLKVCASARMGNFEAVIAAHCMALPALKDLFILLAYFLYQSPDVAMLAYPHIDSSIIVVQ